MTARKCISIVTACYNEEDNVQAAYDAVKRVMEERLSNYDYEHIFSDNASKDRTVEILTHIAAGDKRVKVTVNSRNVGPFRNTFNGMKKAKGDAILVLLAADLQDPPELIADFVELWEKGYKIVYGIRRKREEPFWLRTARKAYYRLVEHMSDVHVPSDAGEFQLIDRVVCDSVLKVDDYYPYIRGLIAQTGFSSIGVPYTWLQRKHGVSKNKMFHLIDQALNGIISTSKTPLRVCILLGFLLSVLSIGYAIYSLIANLFKLGEVPMGIPTVIVALFFFNGLLLFFIGILGEYVLAIHEQLRRGTEMIEVKKINL